jgi:hypothetical protein
MRCQLPPLNPATWSASKRFALGIVGWGLKTGIPTLVLLHESWQVVESNHQEPRAMTRSHQDGARLLSTAIGECLIEERVGVQALDALDLPPHVHAVTHDVWVFVATESVGVLSYAATVNTYACEHFTGFQLSALAFLSARS